MINATHSTQGWSTLPNLRDFSLNEGLRLSLIVGSLSFVILAGQFAQSRGQELSQAAVQSLTASVRSEPARPRHSMTETERYAHSQIRTFGELLDGLTERAELVLGNTQITENESARLKASLVKLDDDLKAAREVLGRFEKSNDRFSEEEMRESLIAVQDSAFRAQSQLVTFDRPERNMADRRN